MCLDTLSDFSNNNNDSDINLPPLVLEAVFGLVMLTGKLLSLVHLEGDSHAPPPDFFYMSHLNISDHANNSNMK